LIFNFLEKKITYTYELAADNDTLIPLIKPSNNFLYNKWKTYLFTEGILVKEFWVSSKLDISSGNHFKIDVTVSNGNCSLSIQLFNNWIIDNGELDS